jgi:CheY-like chemotaxis protein
MSEKSSTILVVDDDPATRSGVVALLEGEGFTVLSAENGRRALELLQRAAPRLILLDLMMPEMDGWQFLQERRRAPGGSSAPVVLMSGLGFIHGASGIADFVRKPIDAEQLLDCVNRYCGAPARRPART